jgi:tRNA (guanine37-N1)-methyltransferase
MPEYPHYPRPPAYRGWQVPDVLVSGDHEKVRSWRAEQSRMRAAEFDRGPD